jgi:hypothetical protein
VAVKAVPVVVPVPVVTVQTPLFDVHVWFVAQTQVAPVPDAAPTAHDAVLAPMNFAAVSVALADGVDPVYGTAVDVR